MLPQATDPMEYFDRNKPTVTQIRQRYNGNFIDLRDYFHDHGELPNIVVAEAIINAAKYNNGLIIPKEYSFWDRGKTFKRAFLRNELGIHEVPISTPLRFKKLGDELNITTTKLTKVTLPTLHKTLTL